MAQLDDTLVTLEVWEYDWSSRPAEVIEGIPAWNVPYFMGVLAARYPDFCRIQKAGSWDSSDC